MPKEDLIQLRSLLIDYADTLRKEVYNDKEGAMIETIDEMVENIENKIQY